MSVWGRMRRHRAPAMTASPTSERNFARSVAVFQWRQTSSRQRKPVLCRVWTYSLPVLPSPTTRCDTGRTGSDARCCSSRLKISKTFAMCHKSFPPHAAFRRRQRRKRNNGRKTSPDAPKRGAPGAFLPRRDAHIIHVAPSHVKRFTKYLHLGKVIFVQPLFRRRKIWYNDAVADHVYRRQRDSGVSCKGRCLFPCLRRACGAGRCRRFRAQGMPGNARRSPAKPGKPRGTPHGETAEQNPPQPSDAHGAARKLPDVKNIFI